MKKQLLCFVILAICGSAYAQVPSYVPSNGLVGWWPFNGNANDESGNGNNGTNNGATLFIDRFANANKSYSFDGVNDYLMLNNLSHYSKLTISLWISVNSYGNASQSLDHSTILMKGNPWYSSNGYSFLLNRDINNINARGINLNIAGTNSYFFPYNWQINQWYHILITINGNIASMYVNNIFIKSFSNIISLPNSNSNFFLANGNTLVPASYLFPGKIDDIGIWNRALDANEISSLFIACNKSITQQPGNQGMYAGNATFSCATDDTLVSYQWQINAGTGWNTLNDAGQVTGSTTKSLNINNVTSFNNNQKFRCIIKGNCLTDTTQEATLRVWGLGINGVNLPEFNLYPNPSSNAVTIAYSQNPYSIEVYNSIGQMVLSQSALANEHTFDISQWPKGVYFVELTDAATQTNKVQKLIRN